MTDPILIWTVAAYLIAAIPFSVLIGRVIFGVNIRQYGDGNPGATNVKRASGSMFWFIVAVFLDGGKGLFPVGIAYWIAGIQDMRIVPIAIAAILGHAFSVFLGFKGGKAVAVTGGIWTGITILEMPIVIGILLTYWFLSLDSSDWAVVLMMISLLIYILIGHPGNQVFVAIWIGNFIVVLIKHRHGLTRLPGIRRWLPFLPRSTQVIAS